jgi:hypothetical protein
LRLTAILGYHFDEPSIIDVTSYEDVLKALEDGRMDKIANEYIKYNKEKEAN